MKTKEQELKEALALITCEHCQTEIPACEGLCDEAKQIANEQIEVLKAHGCVLKDPDQTMPEIPSFEYDKEDDRKLLRRGAINYSKLLTMFVRVIELQEGKGK